MNGDPATLSAGAAGAIKLNGSKCTGATTTTTDLIWVDGGPLDDNLTVVNPNAFIPGATAEGSGLSEIELWLMFEEGGNDTVILSYTNEPEEIRFNDDWGIDVGLDGDRDITVGAVEVVKVKAKAGDDIIDGGQFVSSDKLYLYGGPGNDVISGAPVATNRLYGEGGDDEIHGAGSRAAYLYGGPGNDICIGHPLVDIFVADAGSDGADEYYGDGGRDTIDYSKRTNGVSVTPDDGLANDGAPGEADYVDEDVENLTGGSGDDTLIGTSERNTLTGNAGDDSLYGGPERDKFYGGAGDDVIFNDDGVNNETVDCGPGIDDPQPSNDDFTACELI